MPKLIEKLNQELIDLIEKDDKPSVSIPEAAKILGIDVATLRRMVYRGQTPWGFGCEGDNFSNGYGRISKLALYTWMMKGVEL